MGCGTQNTQTKVQKHDYNLLLKGVPEIMHNFNILFFSILRGRHFNDLTYRSRDLDKLDFQIIHYFWDTISTALIVHFEP